MAQPAQIIYRAPRTLSRFLDSDAFVRCVVGPVGSGKSTACVVELLVRATAQKPGPNGIRRTRFAIIRNTYSQLRDTTRKTFEQWVPQEWGRWNEQAFTFHIKRGDIDCEILFRALDRPEDVKKLLSLEITGAYINEAREIPKNVLDVLQTRVGRYPSKAQGGASWRGIWMDTNPWHTGHWGYKLFSRERPEGYVLFEQPGGRTPEAENVRYLDACWDSWVRSVVDERGQAAEGAAKAEQWRRIAAGRHEKPCCCYYHRLVAGKDIEWVESYVDGKYPSNDLGSIWGRSLGQLERSGGIAAFDHPLDGVFTAWDLGFTDATGIWFFRINNHALPDVIDHYEAHGEPLSHFFTVLAEKPYTYVKHWLPHDARAKSLQTGSSIVEQFVARCGIERVAIGPELSLVDGIQAARWLLEQPGLRIHSRCEAGVEALREYRYEWDEEARAFSRKPLHNWASHTADAFRYLALVTKHTELMQRKPPPVQTGPIGQPLHELFNLDDLFAERERGTTL